MAKKFWSLVLNPFLSQLQRMPSESVHSVDLDVGKLGRQVSRVGPPDVKPKHRLWFHPGELWNGGALESELGTAVTDHVLRPII